jgi:hypothetical protein
MMTPLYRYSDLCFALGASAAVSAWRAPADLARLPPQTLDLAYLATDLSTLQSYGVIVTVTRHDPGSHGRRIG